MAEPLRDVDLLEALPFAKGDEREVLLIALAYSEGDEAPARLYEICASETGTARAAALDALAKRCGAAATGVLSEALRSRSPHVQGMAALRLAEYGSAEAADAVFGWLNRKLGRRRRAATWDPYELPSAIRFGVRHGRHAEVARIVVRHWAGLHQDEQAWLRRTWPALFDSMGSPTVTENLRLPDEVQADVYQDERSARRFDGPEDWEDAHGIYVRKALANTKRRRLRAAGGDDS